MFRGRSDSLNRTSAVATDPACAEAAAPQRDTRTWISEEPEFRRHFDIARAQRHAQREAILPKPLESKPTASHMRSRVRPGRTLGRHRMNRMARATL